MPTGSFERGGVKKEAEDRRNSAAASRYLSARVGTKPPRIPVGSTIGSRASEKETAATSPYVQKAHLENANDGLCTGKRREKGSGRRR